MMENEKQIQLRTSSDIPALPTEESLAQIRMNEALFPHYLNISKSNRRKTLATYVRTLAALCRIKDFDGCEALLFADTLDEMIMQHRAMSDLTFTEIWAAFTNGVFGLYGEFHGISAPNLYDFLVSFVNSSMKKEATALIVKSKEDANLERTAEERAARQRAIREEIAEAKRNGTFVPTGNWFQPKMVKDNLPNDKAHREKVRQQAKLVLNGKDPIAESLLSSCKDLGDASLK